MKILKSFDTKLDLDELDEAFQKYWEWNVVLIKKHWVKLLLPLSLVILSIFTLAIMLYIIYSNTFEQHKIVFWVLAILYTYTTVSWCFFVILSIIWRIYYRTKSNKQYIDKPFPPEFKKDKLFDKFMKRTFITFLIHLIVLVFNATFPFIFIHETWLWNIFVAITILLINIIFLFLLNRVMYLLIEYEMTFNICTTDWFTTYKQDWFFKTDSMNISSNAIKVIKSTKEWLSWALFQYWNLYIYTDWDLNIKWGKNLELTYIPSPSDLAKKLNSIIEINKDSQNNN